MNKLVKRALCAGVTGITTGIVWYSYVNAHRVVRTELTLESDKVVEDHKLMFISDIHYGHLNNKKLFWEYYNKLVEDKPETVLLGGDIVHCTATEKEVREVFKALSDIPTRPNSCYFVYGNHDYIDDIGNHDFTQLMDVFYDYNIHDLVESSFQIGEIQVIGRRSLKEHEIRDNYTVPVDQLKYALPPRCKFTVALQHVPVSLMDNANAGVDLTLSGHTHAGQIFPGNFLVKKSGYSLERKQQYGQMTSYISSGFGVGKFPFRNLGHCEYVIVNIKSTRVAER